MKTISAGIITKNAEDFIEASIKSYRDVIDELVVIDDMSTDNTIDIIKDVYPEATIIRDRFNGDKQRQRNAYISRIKGDWLFCFDDDEVVSESASERIRELIGNNPELIMIRTVLLNFWKDFFYYIHGQMWANCMQRVVKNIPGMHYDLHHTLSLPNKKILYTYAEENGLVNEDIVYIHHYSYLKSSKHIREKIKYYMRRDNPNCVTEEDVERYTSKHPYFSEKFDTPRYGPGGLYCCGEANGIKEKIIQYEGEHPKPIQEHKLYKEYMKDIEHLPSWYAQIRANAYMENHWQYHNHLDQERHQRRIRFTAKQCVGKTIEIGCANGFSTSILAEANPDCTFEGLEPTKWGYEQAVANYPWRKFYKGWAEEMPFDDCSYDTVLMPEIIEHCEDPTRVIKEAVRVASKKIVITHPMNEAGMLNDPDHKRYYTYDGIRDFCSQYGKFKYDTYTLNYSGQQCLGDSVFFGITVLTK